jgi:hypothetical protein
MAYNEKDGYVGFWVENEPYYVLGETYENGGRIYLTVVPQTAILNKNGENICKKIVLSYFQHNKKLPKYLCIHKNGRRYYDEIKDDDKIEKYVRVPNLKNSVILCNQLQQYNNLTINISSLICSRLKKTGNNSWDEIFSHLKG